MDKQVAAAANQDPSRRLSRQARERLVRKFFLLSSLLPLVIVVVVIVALALRARPILEVKSLGELLGGQVWKPLQGEFGFYPFIMGTIWVTVVSMILAVPVCLLSAIYLSEYARPSLRAVMKPMLDLLAAIPSVVYGVWGVIAIVPWVQSGVAPALSRWLGFIPLFANQNPTGFNVLSGSIVLAVMVIPFIIAVTYEVFRVVPDGLREASLALGATRWETVKYAVLPQTRAGVLAGVVLGASRALGETMAVLMVVGNVAKTPTSIFDPAYPLPALIANNYGEMLSIPLYDAALLGAALILLLVVLVFNILATLVLRQIIAKPL
ncbi:MAG: phosphate ABC transporter permease subunit PstC [Anaerolineales bacterium]|nr:phosphate ABC transporter permease subunit PstC [Anaerolineales bacterium]